MSSMPDSSVDDAEVHDGGPHLTFHASFMRSLKLGLIASPLAGMLGAAIVTVTFGVFNPVYLLEFTVAAGCTLGSLYAFPVTLGVWPLCCATAKRNTVARFVAVWFLSAYVGATSPHFVGHFVPANPIVDAIKPSTGPIGCFVATVLTPIYYAHQRRWARRDDNLLEWW